MIIMRIYFIITFDIDVGNAPWLFVFPFPLDVIPSLSNQNIN